MQIDEAPSSESSGKVAANALDERLSALMQAAQRGDADSYRILLSEVVPLLRQAVRRRCRNFAAPDVEDVVQEVLISVHAARATYDPRRPFLPWLMAIVRNRAADSARRQTRRAQHEQAVEFLPETFPAEPAKNIDGYGDPEALLAAIEKLPPGQKQAVRLLKLQEASLKEAAEATGMSVAALKVAVHRAVKALKAAMKGKPEDWTPTR